MWTDNEKQILIENYPIMTTSELMILLNKSEGQIRGMKERLGLNQKLNVFTNEEKELIRKFYEENSEQLNLDDFAKKLNRPKTSICRYANKEGLTKSSRPMTELKKKTLSDKAKEFILTEKYQKEIYPNQVALLTYYAQNEHPKGMLNKHHTDDVRQKMSKSHIELARNMTTEEKHDIAMKAVQTRLHNGGYNTTSNAYSRCKGDIRSDLDCYFRSAWEANVARILNCKNIKWEYEIKRFFFEEIVDGVASYQPDFYLPEYDKWIEVKGWMDQKSKVRLKLFQEQFPDEYNKLILIDEKYYNQLRADYSYIENWEK